METKNITRIYLLRHGESLGNFNKECLGHTDKDLTDIGLKQAQATAEILSHLNFDGIYSSDLIRAYNTALPHANMRGMGVEALPSLRELFFGKWEGMKVADISDIYGDMFTVDWLCGFGTFTPPDGEYVQDCADRMYKTVFELANKHSGGNLLIASHGAAIRALWGRLLGLNAEDVCAAIPFPVNGSFSVIEFSDGVLRPTSYSNAEHLASVK